MDNGTEYQNVFSHGCLVQLSISKWGGVRKLSKEQIARMVENGNSEWVSATKKLVDPDSLKPICKIANAARSALGTISLPFPINGLLFIPRDLISQADNVLSEFRDNFNRAVYSFRDDYYHLRESARLYLGDLFNEVDYPAEIENKFNFSWRFVVMDVPNGSAGVLSPEIYEREKEKFVQTMEEARQMAVSALREEFAEMVERICDRFTDTPDGKPKVFKNATVDSFYQYFETFKERNIFQDASLQGLVEQAQSILSGRTPEEIRDRPALKEAIRAHMTEVEDAMSQAFERPKRRIVLD